MKKYSIVEVYISIVSFLNASIKEFFKNKNTPIMTKFESLLVSFSRISATRYSISGGSFIGLNLRCGVVLVAFSQVVSSKFFTGRIIQIAFNNASVFMVIYIDSFALAIIGRIKNTLGHKYCISPIFLFSNCLL